MNTQLMNSGFENSLHNNATPTLDENTTLSTNADEWRNKEADRSARQHIARIILSLIMKSANRPVTNNYNPREIARRLEHTLYMNSASRDEYSNLSTLKVRLQRALDNSRRRQQAQQAAALSTTPAETPAAPVAVPAAVPASAKPNTSAAGITSSQAQVMQKVAQAQMQAQAQLHLQAQMQLLAKQSAAAAPAAAASPTASSSNNILEELEREADEMANAGISDQPLEMPVAELESAAPMNNVPLSMPLNMGMMNNRVPMTYGMNLNMMNQTAYVHPTQLQLQQLQQMQLQQIQLQKLQQMQQLQHQMQLNAAANTMPKVATTTTTAAPATAATPGLQHRRRPRWRPRSHPSSVARSSGSGSSSSSTREQGFCAKVKVLLSHVSNCTDAQCTTIGCKSTRQLLSHYRKCRDMACDVCSAIRTQNPASQAYVLRRQQERLCMLRHASTCAIIGCPMNYCADMKVLWKHICECRQTQCTTDHCISSRYVLSHFKQCPKSDCGVCVPVRNAIKIIDMTKNNPTELQALANACTNDVKVLIRQMTTIPIQASDALDPSETAKPLVIPSASPALMKNNSLGQLPMPTAASAAAMQSKLKPPKATKAKVPAAPPTAAKPKAPVPTAKPPGEDAKTAKKKDPGLPGLSPNVPPALTPTTALVASPGAGKAKAPANEKDKKIRRKEQARIAKERVKAKQDDPKPPVSTLVITPSAVPGSVVVSSTPSTQDISYLDSMSEAQLDEHIRSLRFNFCGHISIVELKNRLMPLLTSLMETENGWAFNQPVDPVQWNIPDYLDVIKCPMDLGTIKKRLEAEHYVSVDSFASDVRLTSTNKFNIAAKALLAQFEKDLSALKTLLEDELNKRCELRREEMCQLCGGDSFKFAPCMLFCSGPCAGRIRRHTHYYSDPRGEYHWCSGCYKQMKDGPLDMSLLPASTNATGEEPLKTVLLKAHLLKKKNSEVAEEPWVECDSCKLWYHQICGLFNERNHAISGEQEPFVCPFCTKKQRQQGAPPSTKQPLQASRLPATRMATRIEKRVVDALAKAQDEEMSRLGSLGNIESDGSSALHPKSETPAPSFAITIREVLSVDKQVQMKPRMAKMFALKTSPKANEASGSKRSKNASESASAKKAKLDETNKAKKVLKKADKFELTYRSRCICVFQELDGVDVLIFTLYVQEYGEQCAEPNRGRVYISYLDSVAYFQPKKFRVLMHQQVILGFLDDAKMRGYHTAHIWSCPPLKGDDYIFFCKPENQKIPKAARLRSWYSKLLQGAKKEGLVYNISNLYAEYYVKKKTALELPYFEGDYWPRLAEDLIKQVEDKASGKGNGKTAGKASRKTDEPAPSASPPTTTSTPTETHSDAATTATSSTAVAKPIKTKGEVNNDPIMQKLKAILEPQKEDFFVVDLHPRCHKCTSSVINKTFWALKTLAPSDGVDNVIEGLKKAKSAQLKSSMVPRHYSHYYCAPCYESSKTSLLARVEAAAAGAKKAQELYATVSASTSDPATYNYNNCAVEVQDLKFELSLSCVASSLLADQESGADHPMAELALEPDEDALMPCEIFDTREAFLMYCQNNHCQFDQVRRSKHSSMMVLYHLFNQGTTGFTFSCAKCAMTLTSGHRWNCSICLNFNLCDGCRGKTKHEHPLHAFHIVSIPQPKYKTSAETDALNALPAPAPLQQKKKQKKQPAAKKGKGSLKKMTKTEPPPVVVAMPTPDAAPVVPKVEPVAAPAATPPPQPQQQQQQQRIVDPQLLVQLEHASLCQVGDACTYVNCNRMRAMLKHGATCEARKLGPCQLCKRIVGLLSAHAKQCTKPLNECKVPRCTEIRRLVQQHQMRAADTKPEPTSST
ncbi:hypothetical protein SPRG_19224 [Saprolegnia parasitica CBS 223.65]|uniref:histone acetyltransferase n=1 Tax=Saprolegnia parasitica (strain CBS 223.65) TaxID=695850 RepID=A0A067D3K2_SAPPC|nr:hypothetical protein SPRG_19224 [Saprolegnia parasitica CBS 223.65]KDO33592.1 hypothetical protein SPRG_19224 [Saprolegnia parasitica CBS 223.65]|eukprot:XP_012195644.1 hypothetical protein SPRG_19224 [Saprolegnia parasitica CBS 223.65]